MGELADQPDTRSVRTARDARTAVVSGAQFALTCDSKAARWRHMSPEIDIEIATIEGDEIQITVPAQYAESLYKFLQEQGFPVRRPEDFLTGGDGKVIDQIIYASDTENRIRSAISEWRKTT